jgi:predicted transcriptional regulator
VKAARWLNVKLTARDLMRSCEATLRPDDSIERAARVMRETETGAVPVVDASNRLIGMITGRDITMKLVALGASIPHAQVSDCMNSEAFACSADNSLESCVAAMCWHQVRRLPIVDDEHRVLGTISQRDLARYVCDHPDGVDRQSMADILWALAS